MSPETKAKQEQLGKNLTRIFSGINGTGHKDFPKPIGEAIPNTHNLQKTRKNVVTNKNG